MEEALKDERFSHILSDPRFRKMPKRIQRVMLDKRMKTIFKDSSFKGKCELDKRGRQLNLTPTENLKKLYDVTSESSDEDEDEDEEENSEADLSDREMKQKCDSKLKNSKNETKIKAGKKKEKNANKDISQTTDSEESTSEESDSIDDLKSREKIEVKKAQTVKEKKKKLPKDESDKSTSEESDSVDDLESRKKIEEKKEIVKEKKKRLPKDDSDKSSSEESNDSESESDDSSGDQSEDFDHKWEELRNEAPDTNEITRRLAVCNMDWDRIRAVDLLVCFNSFKPPDGSINSVKIYPSEFGLERMEEEKLKGPPELVEETLPLDDEEELQDRKGSKYHREKLRQYQIRRLKYYYAVVDCDSPETADVLYEQLNGMEYESSSVRFDLRFIPDDVTFEHEPVSSADKPPDPTDYKPRLFVTSALQQVKVDLTWDETDPKRREFFQKIFTDPDSVQNDIQEYLASASSESEVEENTAEEEFGENMKTTDRIAKYRELLQSLEEKEKKDDEKYDMEVTWEPSVKERAEEQVREKIKKDTLNPFEEMLQKKKEKRKQQKTISKQEEESVSDDSDEEFFEKSSVSNGKEKADKKLAELALITDSKKEMDSEDISKKKKKNKKDKSKDLDQFVGNPNDPRFAAMYSSSLFNMIPSSNKKTENKFAGKSEKKRKFKPSKSHGFHKKPKH